MIMCAKITEFIIITLNETEQIVRFQSDRKALLTRRFVYLVIRLTTFF